ncbi:hypothetical protein [Bradyrhizobium sp. HKCCYLRH3083]|uniref:hypothetical protein n=1 Tax=unclassified Bradyrhizobium TaxID=2631580 RepID=UPI003EBEFD5A
MITDDQLDDLPEDDLEAFIAFEAILNNKLDDRAFNQGWDIEREYVAYILAFVEARNIDLHVSKDTPLTDDNFSSYFAGFRRAVESFRAKARLEISARRRVHRTSFHVATSFKTQIGAHLTAIRKIVHEAHLTESKRDAIFRRIETLQFEVDRDRTRAEVVTGLWLDITSAIGAGAKNLDPAIERLERIMKVFAQARDEDAAKLPAPAERKRIPPPSASPTSDDEVPF